MTARTAIETRGLGRDYGDVRALDGLDLDVLPGSLVGLLGPNGAGKTTALLLLATLLAPSRGEARLLDYDILRQRRLIRRRLGLVFQEASIDGLLTVRENLDFAARLAGLSGPDGRRAVADALERTGLIGRADQPARQLSGGWRRLTDIARATLHHPDLLLLDEPTVGLDPEHRERMWSILEGERQSRGVTILFSTHYLTEAEPSDRVVLLSRGKVVAADQPAALKAGLGEQMAEFEGAGADELRRGLEEAGMLRSLVRTDRGYRLGIGGPREGVVRLAGQVPGLSRFALREVTLEDVYFARTLGGDGPG